MIKVGTYNDADMNKAAARLHEAMKRNAGIIQHTVELPPEKAG